MARNLVNKLKDHLELIIEDHLENKKNLCDCSRSCGVPDCRCSKDNYEIEQDQLMQIYQLVNKIAESNE